MPDNTDLFDQQHIWHPYASMPNSIPSYHITSAKGCSLFLQDGSELIDGMASWWSAIHGYNHPVLNAAVTQQLDNMSHVMFGGLTHEPAIELAKKLCKLTPAGLDYVFFSDSGSVAVEVAMKMALQFWHAKKTHSDSQNNTAYKNKFISLRGGYHGDTFAAMSVCDPVTGMHHLFSDNLQQQIFAPKPQAVFSDSHTETVSNICTDDLKKLRAVFESSHTQAAAVILEPIVQGAGGMYFYSADFLKGVRELCDEFNVLLIADEIATGFGRTGKLFACEHANISPDILCLGKALTGGYMTLAATLCNEKVRAGIHQSNESVLMHGPTFMANPLACAVANASIDLLLKSPWQEKIKNIEQHLTEYLAPAKNFENVADVRVLGAIGVIELKQSLPLEEIQPLFVKEGVWIRPFGKLIYIMPPFIINNEQLQTLCKAMLKIAQIKT